MPSGKLLALPLSLLPTSLAAQEPAAGQAQELRAGQWGVQFGAGFGLANVGVMRFTSPSSAWLLLFDVR